MWHAAGYSDSQPELELERSWPKAHGERAYRQWSKRHTDAKEQYMRSPRSQSQRTMRSRVAETAQLAMYILSVG